MGEVERSTPVHSIHGSWWQVTLKKKSVLWPISCVYTMCPTTLSLHPLLSPSLQNQRLSSTPVSFVLFCDPLSLTRAFSVTASFKFFTGAWWSHQWVDRQWLPFSQWSVINSSAVRAPLRHPCLCSSLWIPHFHSAPEPKRRWYRHPV